MKIEPQEQKFYGLVLGQNFPKTALVRQFVSSVPFITAIIDKKIVGHHKSNSKRHTSLAVVVEFLSGAVGIDEFLYPFFYAFLLFNKKNCFLY